MRLRPLLPGFILSLFMSLFTLSGMAGNGHDHGHGHGHSHTQIDQATATINATKIVAALANRNKLDKSWESITASSTEKQVYEGAQEWLVIFVNDKIKDPARQKLYIFLTLGGDYIAANFTGK